MPTLPPSKGPKLAVVQEGIGADPLAPPPHLGEAGLRLWHDIQRSYAIDDPGGRALLAIACEAGDRLASCRLQLDRDGEVIMVRGLPRAHPAAQIERDARSAQIRALKELRLDVEPLRDKPGRPSGSRWT
jgi:phage terminase small subunit